jgi:DNA-directed RNA polymerase specialized sigma24 family protein
MPKNRRHGRTKRNNTPADATAAHEKIARLLGIIATKGLDRNRQVMLLRGVGFAVEEIAEMLGISANNVRVASHYGRKKGPKKLKKSHA